MKVKIDENIIKVRALMINFDKLNKKLIVPQLKIFECLIRKPLVLPKFNV